MPRTIRFFGSVALLVSSITGPSLVVVPLLFQEAGWLTPLIAFALISQLSGTAGLFLTEIMSSIEGNEDFQASVEYTTIAHIFLGKRWHYIVQALLYLALQTLVIASLLESFQSLDAFLITVAHKTCAISFTDGTVCINQMPSSGSSAFTGYIFGSFGTLITLCLILPLSLVRLVDNIIFQIISFILLLMITVTWIVLFVIYGLGTNPVPVVASNQSSVVGFVLSNFSFVATIPAWVNNTHPSVNIRHAVWASVLISCIIYIPVGWMGGSAFSFPNGATLLQVLASDVGQGAFATVAHISGNVFPLSVLITSIPVFTIVIRYNLLRGNVCSNKMAIFWSAILPWIVVIPLQTNQAVATILNWASLIFTCPANLLVPFILFIVSKRHVASAVLDKDVSPETLTLPELGASSPAGRRTSDLTRTPENVPIVIITESTDVDPDSTTEAKTLVSRSSGEGIRSSLDVIPMPVVNRVSSPSKHRYYGQDMHLEGSIETPDGHVHAHGHAHIHGHGPYGGLFHDANMPATETHGDKRQSALSISLTPSHSIMHSSHTGMDEFLLMGPSSPKMRPHSMRSVLTHSPRPSADLSLSDAVADERGQNGEAIVPPSILSMDSEVVPVFKAYPCLSPTSIIRPTRISAVALVISSALVLTAIIYNIVQTVGG